MEREILTTGSKEREEFETIVYQYINDIRKLVFSYVNNKETMEDITQEVFITAFQNLNRFKGESSIKTWLYRIAINKSKDYLKSWHYRYTSLVHFFHEKDSGRNVENEILKSLRNQELANVIMSIPIKYREIIILYYYHDQDTTEISNLLRVNVSTVRTRLTRAREIIKRRFDSEWIS